MLLVLICMNHVFKFHYTTVLVSDRLLYIGLSEVYTHRLSGMLENAYRYSSNAKIKDFYIYKDHKILTAQKLHVIGSNTHIRGIQVELIEDMLLFRWSSSFETTRP